MRFCAASRTSRVSVDADGQPFWSVLGTVRGQLHEWLYLNPTVPITDSPIMVHGAIMVQPMQLSYLKNIALSDNAAEKDQQGIPDVQLWGFCEPKGGDRRNPTGTLPPPCVEAKSMTTAILWWPARFRIKCACRFSQGFLMDVGLVYHAAQSRQPTGAISRPLKR